MLNPRVTLLAHRDSSEDSNSDDEQYKQNQSLRFIMAANQDGVKSKPFFSSFDETNAMASQEHAHPRMLSRSRHSLGTGSLTSSIARFRTEFDDMRHKMQIFGESLNLCKCIGLDFDSKVSQLEKRLEGLEKRQRVCKSQSNYSYIIKKNKHLSTKTLNEAKKLQLCGTEEEMREVAGRICRNYLHGAWKTVEAKELEFRRISGGLSNFLYYVALPETLSKAKLRESLSEEDTNYSSATIMHRNSFIVEEPKKVLLRIYGQVHGERAMDAIVTESVIFTLLSERRLGPKLHGVFSGGRIEEYIPSRPLLTKELAEPALSMKIAEKMAAIHSMDIPLSKEPNWLWKTMGKWMNTVKEERLTGNVKGKNDEETYIINRLKTVDFYKEVEWLKKFLAAVESPVVFCHNDMQEGNILMLDDTNAEEDIAYRLPTYTGDSPRKSFDMSHYEDTNTVDSESSHISDCGEPKLYLIDFEYCAYNHRGFDLANHFQEWVYDYTNPEYPHYFENLENSPTLEQKEIFIREYLKHYNTNTNDAKDAAPTIDDVNHLLNEVDAFALASHLFWCLWSIVNASKSQIPFGYWEYGMARFDTYIRLKQEVVKKDKFGPQKRKICEVDI